MARNRSWAKLSSQGTWSRFGSTFGGGTWQSETAGCTDLPGYGLGDNLPFTVNRDLAEGGVVNMLPGTQQQWAVGWFDNYVADAVTFAGRPVFPLITSYPDEKTSAAYAADALARTNPNRPYVDVVQNVLEAGDIPRVLKVAGENLIEKLAENYLRYQFGIKPLIKDVVRTINFADAFDRRLKEITRLKKSGGVRKTVDLDSLSNSQVNSNVTLMSQGGIVIRDTYTTIGQRKIRAHVRWLPGVDYSRFSQGDMSRMAMRSIFGLEANLSGLWEGLPWSWLIDWYTNIGSLLMQTRNLVPVSLQNLSLMRETTSTSATHEWKDQYRVCSPALIIKTRKERYSASATLDAHLPLLEAGQMGILASLLVMKHKYVSPR